MWIYKPTQLALTIILIQISLLGCNLKTPELAGTEWDLISLDGKVLIEGTAITLNFADEYLGGEMDCNLYGGSPDGGKYRAAGDGTLTLILPLAVTVQLCTEPEGIMEQEAAYIEALMNTTNFRTVDNHLEIDDEDGEIILIFQAK